MKVFFLFLEVFALVYFVYVLIKKRELAILHLPVVLFIYFNVITRTFPYLGIYALYLALLILLIYNYMDFIKNNIFSVFMFLWMLFLMTRINHWDEINKNILVLTPTLFLYIPMIISVYRNNQKEKIFTELGKSSVLVLIVFILNVGMASITKYIPDEEMYGINSGILFGNMFHTDFNILPFCILVVLLSLVEKKNLLYLFVFGVAFFLIMLSLRRTVMAGTLLALIFVIISLVFKGEIKKVGLFGGLIFGIILLVFKFTNFSDQLIERIELRNLEERDMAEEKRFFEYELIYNDVFVFFDYNPLIGNGLFNNSSSGNYGRGIFFGRPLHADITHMIHSSGLISVIIYFFIVFSSFRLSFAKLKSKNDYFIFIFCIIMFLVFTVTGRYTQTSGMLMFFLLLFVPIAKNQLNSSYFENQPRVTHK